jgi:predicted ATPase
MDTNEQMMSEKAFVNEFIDRLYLGIEEIIVREYNSEEHDKHQLFHRLIGNEIADHTKRLVIKHTTVETPFELWDLSVGTIRMLELLPHLYALSNTTRCLLVDELYSHLHTKLFTS